MGLDSMLRHCAECGGERAFEQPQCEDGHGDCPDWGCTECGMAIWVGGSAARSRSPQGVSTVASGATAPSAMPQLRATA